MHLKQLLYITELKYEWNQSELTFAKYKPFKTQCKSFLCVFKHSEVP